MTARVPKAQKPEACTSLIKTLKSLGSCMYSPGRTLEANFALPEPTQNPKSQKRQTRACSKPENLRLAHHWSKI